MAKRHNPGVQAAVLASYSVRRRVVRGADGVVSLLWGSMGLRVSHAEFLGLAGVFSDALRSAVRYGELARGERARVVRCSMGQVTLHYEDLTLWFSPEEFEDLARLAIHARQRLADAPPPPPLGLPWKPEGASFGPN